jgi:hypothetical protein
MTKTDVGVDAVLSADVGDAPMRQRQYTAPAPTQIRRDSFSYRARSLWTRPLNVARKCHLGGLGFAISEFAEVLEMIEVLSECDPGFEVAGRQGFEPR